MPRHVPTIIQRLCTVTLYDAKREVRLVLGDYFFRCDDVVVTVGDK